MGGIHAVWRQTPEKDGYIYNAVSSDLTVPTSALARYPDGPAGDATGNIVPEFFHVFHKPGAYTIDAGVAYVSNNQYRLFFNLNSVWTPGPLATATGTKVLKAWFSSASGKYYVNMQFGSINHQASISAAMFNALNGGCKIYREIVIASNGSNTVPGNAYYKNATFSNTTLTRTNGTYVAMSGSNTVLYTEQLDNNIPANWKTYCNFKYSSSGSTFISDTSSGTFNKIDYPV